MNNIVTFCLALLLGVTAAGINWMWVSAKAKPPEFVAVQSPIQVGDEIKETDLIAAPVPGNLAALKKSFIPFANRSILYGLKATRAYSAGDVVLHRDIQPPAESSQWQIIGPFRLISVGDQFSQDDSYAAHSGDNNVTIAVDKHFDEQTKRLLEVISPNRHAENVTAAQTIVAVQVVPSNRSSQAKRHNSDDSVVYQTVSLQGIANVPRVLLEGDMIRFVVPGTPKY